MKWETVQQLIRIAAYSGGTWVFGEGVTNGELYQQAVGGVMAVGAFLWWMYVESTKPKV